MNGLSQRELTNLTTDLKYDADQMIPPKYKSNVNHANEVSDAAQRIIMAFCKGTAPGQQEQFNKDTQTLANCSDIFSKQPDLTQDNIVKIAVIRISEATAYISSVIPKDALAYISIITQLRDLHAPVTGNINTSSVVEQARHVYQKVRQHY